MNARSFGPTRSLSSARHETTPLESTPIASCHWDLCSNSAFVTPQTYRAPSAAPSTAAGCESGTYGERTAAKPVSGAARSGAARTQLPTSCAGWPKKRTRWWRSSDSHSSIVSWRKRRTSLRSDAPANWSAPSVGISTGTAGVPSKSCRCTELSFDRWLSASTSRRSGAVPGFRWYSCSVARHSGR